MHKLALAALFLVTGCSGPSYSLRPEAGPGEFKNGREFRSRELQGVKVAVALEEYHSGEATFRVNVENGAKQKLDVMPSAVSCSTNGGPASVVDPERQLAELRSREADLDPSGIESTARLANETALLTTSFSKDEQNRQLHAEAEARDARYQAEDKERADKRAGIETEKKYWSDQALRRTTLAHGESVTGDVVCKTPADYNDLTLRVTMPGGSADFHFERYELN